MKKYRQYKIYICHLDHLRAIRSCQGKTKNSLTIKALIGQLRKLPTMVYALITTEMIV